MAVIGTGASGFAHTPVARLIFFLAFVVPFLVLAAPPLLEPYTKLPTKRNLSRDGGLLPAALLGAFRLWLETTFRAIFPYASASHEDRVSLLSRENFKEYDPVSLLTSTLPLALLAQSCTRYMERTVGSQTLVAAFAFAAGIPLLASYVASTAWDVVFQKLVANQLGVQVPQFLQGPTFDAGVYRHGEPSFDVQSVLLHVATAWYVVSLVFVVRYNPAFKIVDEDNVAARTGWRRRHLETFFKYETIANGTAMDGAEVQTDKKDDDKHKEQQPSTVIFPSQFSLSDSPLLIEIMVGFLQVRSIVRGAIFAVSTSTNLKNNYAAYAVAIGRALSVPVNISIAYLIFDYYFIYPRFVPAESEDAPYATKRSKLSTKFESLIQSISDNFLVRNLILGPIQYISSPDNSPEAIQPPDALTVHKQRRGILQREAALAASRARTARERHQQLVAQIGRAQTPAQVTQLARLAAEIVAAEMDAQELLQELRGHLAAESASTGSENADVDVQLAQAMGASSGGATNQQQTFVLDEEEEEREMKRAKESLESMGFTDADKNSQVLDSLKAEKLVQDANGGFIGARWPHQQRVEAAIARLV